MSGSGPVVYIDHSEVREGKLDNLQTAIKELAQFVKANEPLIVVYKVYFTQGGKRMTVIHIHPNSASLEFHMKVAGPAFAKFADYVRMLTINIYGEINDGLLEKLREKARILGSASVAVHEPYTGFTRFGVS